MAETALEINENDSNHFQRKDAGTDCPAYSADSVVGGIKHDIKGPGSRRLPHEVLMQIVTAYSQFLAVQRSS